MCWRLDKPPSAQSKSSAFVALQRDVYLLSTYRLVRKRTRRAWVYDVCICPNLYLKEYRLYAGGVDETFDKKIRPDPPDADFFQSDRIS